MIRVEELIEYLNKVENEPDFRLDMWVDNLILKCLDEAINTVGVKYFDTRRMYGWAIVETHDVIRRCFFKKDSPSDWWLESINMTVENFDSVKRITNDIFIQTLIELPTKAIEQILKVLFISDARPSWLDTQCMEKIIHFLLLELTERGLFD